MTQVILVSSFVFLFSKTYLYFLFPKHTIEFRNTETTTDLFRKNIRNTKNRNEFNLYLDTHPKQHKMKQKAIKKPKKQQNTQFLKIL